MRLFSLLVLSVIGLLSAVHTVAADTVYVYDRRDSGVFASTYVYGRNIRELNYQVGSESWFTLDAVANTFTLDAGTYSITAEGEIDGEASDHRLFLTNVSDSEHPLDVFAGPPRTPYTEGFLDTLVTVTDPSTTYSIVHSTRGENGYLGEPTTYIAPFDAPDYEIYLTLRVRKIA